VIKTKTAEAAEAAEKL